MTIATTRLEETIRSEMERNRMPGLAIALIRGDEVVFAEGYGVTSVEGGEPVTPETRFAIMSVTKPIVVTAMMQLRDASHLQLDDPANKHLAPETAIANQWEADSPVTIRQLMTHSAGLPVISSPTAQKYSLADYVKTFGRTSHKPGTEIVYANVAFDAMGVLIEKFSGQQYDAYLHDHIFEPLGMSSTKCVHPAEGEPHASGHYLSAIDGIVRTLPPDEWPTTIPSPAGACWSNVLDVARFLIAHLNGDTPILSPETATEMQQLQFRQSGGTGQGLGFRVTRANGRKLICHGGDGGGFTALAAAHPNERVGVVLLQNAAGMQSARSVIGNSALQALLDDERKSSARSLPIPQGTYKSTFWDIIVEARPNALIATQGLVLLGEADKTTVDGTSEGHGGMFHGFEVTRDGDRFYGGVYPFTFVRTGDLPTVEPIDDSTDLTGAWRGTSQTPMGPLAVTVTVTSGTSGTVDTPFAQDLPLKDCTAESGRLSGEFSMQVPGVGDTQMFLRLELRGGVLTGKTYGRSKFGEAAMQTDLERA